MPLDTDVMQELDTLVRGGFEDRDRIVEILTEEMFEPGELDADEVEAAVDAALDAHEHSKAGWPAMTDCDRLDSVFDALEARGLVALQFAGFTQSDGFSDVSEVYAGLPDKGRVIGYCFYHGQDLARAVNGAGLHLAFGPVDPALEETEGSKVGVVIVEELHRAGFRVEWDGTFKQRIFVPDIDWQRR